MPNFDATKLRKGKEVIRQANEQRKQGGGSRKPFLNNIFWGNDGDEHYVLVLNPMSEAAEVDYHPFIELDDGFPHQIIARTDPIIGERSDPISDEWKYKPRLTTLLIAVELEPVFKTVDGYERPAGFEVVTRTFERRVRDDEGELTDEREEVTIPLVGFIAQSPYNFSNQLESYDNSEGPVHRTPLKVKRLGKTDVTYQVVGYPGVDVDLSNLFEFIEFVSYIPDEVIEELLGKLDDLNEQEAAVEIGQTLLDLKLNELCDPDEYTALFDQITKPNRFADKGKGAKKSTARVAKPSQRRGRKAETEVAVVEPEVEPEVEEAKPAARSRRRVTKDSPARERLSALKERGDG